MYKTFIALTTWAEATAGNDTFIAELAKSHPGIGGASGEFGLDGAANAMDSTEPTSQWLSRCQ